MNNEETQQNPQVPTQEKSPEQPQPQPQTIIIPPHKLFNLKPNEKLRFCLVSTHIEQFTGYSKVSYEIVNHFSKIPGIQLYHFGFQRVEIKGSTHRTYPENVISYDAAAEENPKQAGFGFNVFRKYIEEVKPHIVLIYNDIGIIRNFIVQLQGIQKNFLIAIYYDQVYEFTRQPFIQFMNQTIDKIFFFTEYWKQYGISQGISNSNGIIMHGINPEMFYPLSDETRRLRREMLGFKPDDFVILNINRNTKRKRYDLLVTAFAEFVKRHNAGYLLVSTNPDAETQGGWNFLEIYQEELHRRSILTKENFSRIKVIQNHMRHTDDNINMLYNVADIGINTADGEGFGLCNFEHAVVGRPQIVGNLGGFKEFFSKHNAYMVEPSMEYYMPSKRNDLGGRAQVCHPNDIADGMTFYYKHPETRKLHGERARETILTYTWSRALKELEDWVCAFRPREEIDEKTGLPIIDENETIA
jgi:glycosyltransferase involved in cell wall biosynthesis